MGNEAGISGGKVKRFSMKGSNPVPFWLKARVQVMDFQRHDLRWTHGKKFGVPCIWIDGVEPEFVS